MFCNTTHSMNNQSHIASVYTQLCGSVVSVGGMFPSINFSVRFVSECLVTTFFINHQLFTNAMIMHSLKISGGYWR